MFTRPLVYVFALIAGPLLLTLVASDNVASVFLAATGNLGSPSNLKVTEVTASSIDLKWNDNSNNETGFQIQRKVGSGSFSTVKTVDANTETYRSNGLSSGKKYTHRVRAVKGSNNSSYSNSVSTTTLSNPWSLINYANQWKLFNDNGGTVTQLTDGVRLTAPSQGEIYLFSKVPANPAEGFRVDFDYTVLNTPALPDSGTWTNIGFVRGDGTAGFPVDVSAWSLNTVFDDALPAHAAGVRATFANKNANNTNQQNEYRLLLYPDGTQLKPADNTYTGDPKITFDIGTPYHVTLTLSGNVLRFVVTSSSGTQEGQYASPLLPMSTSRTIFLRHAGGRNGEIKNFTVTETSSGDTTAPSVPTNLSTSDITTSQIKLTWSASTDNVGVTGYKVYRNGTQVATVATPSYLNTGLTPETSYTFKVSAYDAAGNNSAQSVGVTGVTKGDVLPQATKYVAPGGTATWSAASSINTPASIDTANQNARAGDVVYLLGGTYRGKRIAPINSGTEVAPIIFVERPGDGVVFNGCNSSGCVNLSGKKYITVRDVTLSGESTANNKLSTIAADLSNSNNCAFIKNTVEYFKNGVSIEKATRAQVIDNIFRKVGELLDADTAPTGDSSHGETIDMKGAQYSRVIGNQVTESGHNAIQIKSSGTQLSAWNIVRGNYVSPRWHDGDMGNMTYRALVFSAEGGQGPQHNLMEKNIIEDAGDNGIDRATSHKVEGNANIFRLNLIRTFDGSTNPKHNGQFFKVSTRGGGDASAISKNNRLYNNSYHNAVGASITSFQDFDGSPEPTSGNMFKNSIFHAVSGSPSEADVLATNSFDLSKVSFVNNVWFHKEGKSVSIDGSLQKVTTLAAADAHPALSGKWSENKEADPQWLNTTSLQIKNTSPAWCKAVPLTKTKSAGSGLVVEVEDASYFFDGFGWADEIPDTLIIDGQTRQIALNGIDYINNKITLSQSATWGAGKGVGLANAPHIGAWQGESGCALDIDTTAPSVPTNLSTSDITTSQIKLTWSASTDNVGVTGYKVYRNGTQVATVATPSYLNTGLTPETSYTFKVSAYDAAGNNSAQSVGVTGVTKGALTEAPTAPSALVATGISSNQIDLAWTDNSDNETGFKIERKIGSGGTYALISTTEDGVTSYADMGLTASKTYFYRVRAFNEVGNSAYSNEASATTSPALPPQGGLIFHSGYGGTTALVPGASQRLLFSGIDTDLPKPNDWIKDYEGSPKIENVSIYYEGGYDTERFAKIISEPGKSSNKVLHFWLGQANVRENNVPYKGRIQEALKAEPGALREFSFSVRVFFHPDFNTVKQYPNKNSWLTISEWWNNSGSDDSEPYPFRMSVGLLKPSAEVGSELAFNVHGQYKVGNDWGPGTIWETQSEIPVPIGKWITLDYYLKEGDKENGRFYMAMTPEGGSRQIVFDIRNFTHHPKDPAPDGFTDLNPLKVYTSKAILDFMKSKGKALQMYWDDYEIKTSNGT